MIPLLNIDLSTTSIQLENLLDKFVAVHVDYKGKDLDCDLRCDFLIEGCIVLEVKSVADLHDIHTAQTLNYMNLLKAHRSILINFNVNNIYHEGYETFAAKSFQYLPKE